MQTERFILNRYYVSILGVRNEICKATFMDIFQISLGIVENLQIKIKEGQIFIRDGRGRHFHHNATPQAVKNSMLIHINSYPQYENHYSRAKLGDYYLSSDLTVNEMFRGFIQAHPNIPGAIHMKTTFYEVFNKSGLKIGQPKSDTCKECDRLKVNQLSAISANARTVVLDDRHLHLTTVNTGFEEMRSDIEMSRNDPSYITLCGDLQQVVKKNSDIHFECQI